MVAALGVHRSQDTSRGFSGAKPLAVSAPGCVLALLAFLGLFTTTEERREILGWEGLLISLVKWSPWHFGYSCAHLISVRQAWSTLAKKCCLLDLSGFFIWHIKKEKKFSIDLQVAYQSAIKSPMSVQAHWHTDKKELIAALFYV